MNKQTVLLLNPSDLSGAVLVSSLILEAEADHNCLYKHEVQKESMCFLLSSGVDVLELGPLSKGSFIPNSKTWHDLVPHCLDKWEESNIKVEFLSPLKICDT